ncbi:MAG: hypothetical protein NC311_06500 [Muribaculaceae bacterium]|nr:hypothetical protein [Muribaculaceae bacterium]
MSDLSEMTGRNVEAPIEGQITTPPAAPPDPMAQLAQATGIHLTPEEIAKYNTGTPIPDGDDPEPVSTPTASTIPGVPPIDVPPAAPITSPVTTPAAMDPSEVHQPTEALDPVAMGIAQEQQKYQNVQREKMSGMEQMFQDLEKEEAERLERMEEKAEEMGINVEPQVVTGAERAKAARESGNPDIDDIDLSPGYSEEDAEDEPGDGVTKNSDIKAEDTPPAPGDDEYGDYIRGLPTTTLSDVTADKVIPYISRAPKIITAPRNNGKNQTLNDQAFLNAVNKFKKNTFGTVPVCLVNSGFSVNVVGTGVVDMQNLYMNVSRDTSMYEYELEQMRTVIKNVVGTTPKVQPTQLAQMIHFRDFESLSYAHVCATLESVETVSNCKDCGKAFRITDDPRHLLLNEDELSERAAKIAGAPTIEENSLMTVVKHLKCSNGIVVTIGHPSYAEYIRGIRGFQAKAQEMTPADARRFETMLDMMHFVRSVELPTGVKTTSMYQNYIAMGLLSAEDFDAVSREIENLRKDIITPRFGIRECQCPHCGAINKDIPYRNLLELLFLHTTVSSFLNNPES